MMRNPLIVGNAEIARMRDMKIARVGDANVTVLGNVKIVRALDLRV